MIITTKQMRPRDKHDHYPTPSALCRAALDQVLPADFDPQYILDPGAGTGVWGALAKERWPDAHLIGVELQPSGPPPAYDEWYGMDFYNYAAQAVDMPRPDLIMGNPPYKHAESFVRLSLAMLRPGGYLVQLLRLAFLEGQSRADGLWIEHPPVSVWTCGRRPSFTGNGKTDSTAYAVFVWRKGNDTPGYRGDWLRWDYGMPLPEDTPFRPYRLLPAPVETLERGPVGEALQPVSIGQLSLFEEAA